MYPSISGLIFAVSELHKARQVVLSGLVLCCSMSVTDFSIEPVTRMSSNDDDVLVEGLFIKTVPFAFAAFGTLSAARVSIVASGYNLLVNRS